MPEAVARTEHLDEAPARALAGLLGVPAPNLAAGEGLPLLWHWVYLLDRPDQDQLGPDGHPMRGVLLAPPGPGLRRMWASGRVRGLRPLRCGEPATRVSQVVDEHQKTGRSGSLTFVTVRHEVIQRDEITIEEDQHIVYRRAAGREDVADEPDRAVAGVPGPAPGDLTIEVAETLLFRFSALTYNAHRIHYDRDYARDVEGYAGLVVHGPLQALAMAEAARAGGCPTGGGSFEYRLLAPLLDHQGLIASARPDGDHWSTAIRDRTGRQTASGRLTA